MRVIILLSLAAGMCAAQSDLSAALNQIAASEVSRQKIPGIAAVVVKDGQVVWAEGAGVASLETKIPVTPDTLFRIGSARMFLATAAFELSRQGRLQLDAPADAYLFGLDEAHAQLSARKLLSPPSEAREEAVAAQLIQTIRAKPASAQLEEMIFAPLGMQHTTFSPTLAMTYALALGHAADRSVVRPLDGNALYTSARDLAHFLAAFLNEGKLGDQEALSPAVIAALSNDGGFGLDVDAERGVRLIRHASTAPGYASAMLMAPEFHTGVIVLANRDGASALTIAQKLLERSLPVRFPQSMAIVR